MVSRFDATRTILGIGVPVVIVTAAWIIISNSASDGFGFAGSFKMF